MAKVNIDGKDYELAAGQNLLHAVLSEHLDLPYFCWHPAMGSVGSCRLCAVMQYADEEDQRGRLQMACMMNVQDGMRVSIAASFAADFRKQVIEWLMENHPHDCPVCEEGGECHLQDMTVMVGHTSRSYRGRKRTWRNQDLGPFIGHEMNRCITCYRCVRYYRDYAGGEDLEAFGSRSRMFFGRREDGPLESEFAGNLVEVCPTGVFTDKPFASSYTRKWDLQSAPSICPNCAVGCNTIPGERYGLLKRVHNRYHGQVNGYFLCDRGRYGSHYLNHEKRIRHAGVRAEDGVFEAPGSEAALAAAVECLSRGARREGTPRMEEPSAGEREGGPLAWKSPQPGSAERGASHEILGIGSPRASMEANFALKQLVGEKNFCTGFEQAEDEAMSVAVDVCRRGGFRIPSLRDIESADAVLILGEDISNTAPRMALAVRQAVRGATLEMAREAGIPAWQDAGVRGHGQGAAYPLFIAAAASTRLDGLATMAKYGPAALTTGFAVAGAITAEGGGGQDDFSEAAAVALAAAVRPLVIAGCGAGQADSLRGAANVAWALKGCGKDVMLALTGLEANSFGVALLGGGLSLAKALQRMQGGAPALVLENDLYRRIRSGPIELRNAVVLDSLETPTAEAAAVVLPAAAYAEQTGTFVNYETRAQRFYQVFEPKDEIAPSWRWIAAIAQQCGRNDCSWPDIDNLTSACARRGFAALADAAPRAGFRTPAHTKIPREPHRYSGRTAMCADVSVHEPKASVDAETPLSYSMEGLNPGGQPSALVPFVWSAGWNSNQAVFKFQQEVNGPLAGGDPGVRLLPDRPDGENAAPFSPPLEDGRQGGDGQTSVQHPGSQQRRAEQPGAFASLRLHQVFGSEELSAASAPIAERMPAPYVVLHPQDVKALGLGPGDGVKIVQLNAGYEVHVDANAQAGVVGVVQGLPGARPLELERVDLQPAPGIARITGAARVIAKG